MRTEPVTLLFDVRSPWCYQTSRWLRRLAELGEVTLSFGVFSLEVVNLHDDEDPLRYDAEYGPALRIALALRADHGQRAIGDFYAAFGARMWETPSPDGTELPDVPELTRHALADTGIDPGYAGKILGDEGSWAAVLEEHRRWAARRVFGVPTLLIGDDEDIVFGPVLQALPSDADAVELWRHLTGLTALGTVYELKRFKSLQSRADLPNAVPRADLRVADMRAARALMGRGGPHEGASLEWTMGCVRARRAAKARGEEALRSMADQVTLLAVGDVAPRITAPETQLAGIAPLLRAGDIAFGQLETPLTNEGTRQLFPGFRGASGSVVRDADATAGVLADAGFTVMSFAGNHTMDRSAEAMLASVAAAGKRWIGLVGAGKDLAAAREPVIVTIPGSTGDDTKVGFLAYCSVLPRGFDATRVRAGVAPLRARTFYEQVDWQAGTPPRIITMTNAGDLAALRDDVRRLREQADVVIVSMHWGIHFEPGTIADYQYEAAHAAIDEGADVILGHHGHVIKGIEYYKDKPIFYSLGNVTLLPRGDKGEPLTEGGLVDAQMTMIAKLTIEGGKVSQVAVIPCWLDLRLEPEVIPPGDPRFAGFLAYLRRVNDIPSTPRNSWERMYLPPVDESWALRDTHFTADGGEIVATYSAGVHDKTPWTPKHR